MILSNPAVQGCIIKYEVCNILYFKNVQQLVLYRTAAAGYVGLTWPGIDTLDRKMTSFRQSENIIALKG